ncbi:MAG TPA: hypothetical protein VGG74_28425 [Kofleriaceae bacterium]|jgi:hypothetical protein
MWRSIAVVVSELPPELASALANDHVKFDDLRTLVLTMTFHKAGKRRLAVITSGST